MLVVKRIRIAVIEKEEFIIPVTKREGPSSTRRGVPRKGRSKDPWCPGGRTARQEVKGPRTMRSPSINEGRRPSLGGGKSRRGKG